jgi:hypothetical protein
MGFVVATFSTWVTPTVQVLKGDLWDENDPVVRDHPDWFTAHPGPDQVRTSASPQLPVIERPTPVEAATSAPGEVREVSPSRPLAKKTAVRPTGEAETK